MTARIAIDGNVATEPVLRTTNTGGRVLNFRVASTERRQSSTGEWGDGNSFFVGVACWGALAENVHASIKVGSPVLVSGAIFQREYVDADGKAHTTFEVRAESVGPDLRRGVADFQRVNKHAGPPPTLDDEGKPAVVTADSPFQFLGERSSHVPGDGSYEIVDHDDEEPGFVDRRTGEVLTGGPALAGVAG